MLSSDININVSKLRPAAVSDAQNKFNDNLIAIGKKGPKWWEVRIVSMMATKTP